MLNFEIKEKPNFKLETEYFYSVNDSLVKVILYQWDYLQKSNTDFFEEENHTKKFKAFQTKFDNLTSKLTKEFGEPISKNIEQGKIKDETFRDDLKCSIKYGDYWKQYCKKVPYKIIPFIF